MVSGKLRKPQKKQYMFKKDYSTITIGIPAYNEAANIEQLLTDVIQQDTGENKIENIIVYSDGSDDETVKLSRSFKSKIISVINSRDRKGKAVALNAIIKKSSSDILVLFDADVRLFDKQFVKKLIEPIVTNKAELTSAKVLEFAPKNILQRALKVSMDLKRNIFEDWNNGNNIYTCHGRARALSKRFYSQLYFPFSPSEDAYSYLRCKELKLKYSYVGTTAVYYYLPTTFADHLKQSLRFLEHTNRFNNYFPKVCVDAEYNLPLSLKIKYILKEVVIHPVDLILYVLIVMYIKIILLFSPAVDNQWEVASTSKGLSQ
ncbi:MAG: hypothetical protein COY81_03565 [Candidatus Pacebacteria bacterium CG_4_10_14_0_8_um_filter_43_12]|nr:MAG: hypothetical protein COY81_03565 [Candidatus Pacebacteria bacterium CG_4_10_14_0_8_um_filter_43_12]